MSLANLIALVSSVNADPTTSPDFVEEEPTVVQVVRNAPAKEKRSKASKETAPIHNPNAGKSMTPGISLPERNTLGAHDFLIAMRNAGKRRNDKGVMVVHPNEVRNDQIKAIHAYCGYDNRRDFGSQDVEARAKAQRELRGAPKVVETTAPSRSVAGYVAGMPQPSQRILLNLQARERAAAEAMIEAKTEEERATQRAILDQVQKAIDELTG